MTQEEFKMALEAAYLAGFNASGEGYNAECPFDYHKESPINNRIWRVDRDNYIKEALAQFDSFQEKPKTEPVRIMGFDCFCGRRMIVSAEQGVIPAPERTWVGLNDDEQQELYDTWVENNSGWGLFYSLIETKLKEKNQ